MLLSVKPLIDNRQRLGAGNRIVVAKGPAFSRRHVRIQIALGLLEFINKAVFQDVDLVEIALEPILPGSLTRIPNLKCHVLGELALNSE